MGEALSDAIEALLRNESEPAVSQLVEVEIISALARRVRMSEISLEDAQAIVDRFQTDLDSGFYTRLALEPAHYDMARDWLSRFETSLRTLDALHLAVAASNSIPLITANEGLAESTQAFRIDVQILRPLT
ncbi:MAG: type II toxin-antitoxin system VapC family toxin [Lyngbya sp. HA4199-MV5]|nr:type II toxin-antitoxin system VapC family toxin [Lyngbya sp. HA4199-MV5]